MGVAHNQRSSGSSNIVCTVYQFFIKSFNGTYTLTITGTEADNSLTGDLDILESVNIMGAGADETVIDADEIYLPLIFGHNLLPCLPKVFACDFDNLPVYQLQVRGAGRGILVLILMVIGVSGFRFCGPA